MDSPPKPRPSASAQAAPHGQARGGNLVAIGILGSRFFGYFRELALAHFFANSAFGDAFRAALRIPNALQNLLGEGTLSASFIPIYSRWIAQGRRREAGRFAGAIFGLLLATTAVLVLLGIFFAEPLVTLVARGFRDDLLKGGIDRLPMTVRATRIVFPMTGFVVLAAWTLGILNSHRRFLLPYLAPAAWNAAIITALLLAARSTRGQNPLDLENLLYAACWGALIGGLLQFLVQLPLALKLLGGLRPSLSLKVAGVRQALSSFAPVVAGRGVIQIGSYVDIFLASTLAQGAISALGTSQFLYILPISLFGMSVAAAELPELSRQDPDQISQELRQRIESSLARVAFMVVPTAVGYLAFGWLLVFGLFRTGRFGLDDTTLVYAVLAGYSVGLLPSTLSRLFQSSFYALRRTRVPAFFAASRVVLAALLAWLWMGHFDQLAVPEFFSSATPSTVESTLRLGAVGLSLASAVGAWMEFAGLRRALVASVADLRIPWGRILRMFLLATLCALPAAGLWKLGHQGHWPPRLIALTVLTTYAGLYLTLAYRLRFPELQSWFGRLARRSK